MKKIEIKKIEIEVAGMLVDWIDECVSNGTFENRSKAFEFLVGFMRAQAIRQAISQKTHSLLKSAIPLDFKKFPDFKNPVWGQDLEKEEQDP